MVTLEWLIPRVSLLEACFARGYHKLVKHVPTILTQRLIPGPHVKVMQAKTLCVGERITQLKWCFYHKLDDAGSKSVFSYLFLCCCLSLGKKTTILHGMESLGLQTGSSPCICQQLFLAKAKHHRTCFPQTPEKQMPDSGLIIILEDSLLMKSMWTRTHAQLVPAAELF